MTLRKWWETVTGQRAERLRQLKLKRAIRDLDRIECELLAMMNDPLTPSFFRRQANNDLWRLRTHRTLHGI